jgi:hypothetical protein
MISKEGMKGISPGIALKIIKNYFIKCISTQLA